MSQTDNENTIKDLLGPDAVHQVIKDLLYIKRVLYVIAAIGLLIATMQCGNCMVTIAGAYLGA